MRTFGRLYLQDLEKNVRSQLVNSLAGPRSAYLVGTQNIRGETNLSIVSSCMHLGSNPPLLAIVIRPRASPRHTYENILENPYWTLNNVTSDIVKRAHQSSARYPREVSEFEAVGLTPRWSEGFFAPYVSESTLQIGLKLRETIHLSINGTKLMIGEIQEWNTDPLSISADGNIDLARLGSLCVTGLDSYQELDPLFRLSYAKPDEPVHELGKLS